MLLSNVFDPFIAKRPVCVMARAVLERLFDPARIDRVFEAAAEAGYTRVLHFSTVVQLMADVVLGVQPSIHAAFQAWEAEGTEDQVSSTALYNKLNRVETSVSSALVQDAAEAAAPVIDALGCRFAPWLAGYRCRVIDGNHLSATEHRIQELRTTWAAPLPGRALVVLDQEHMLAERVFLTEDGHMQERKLLDDVLEYVAARDLWIADRNFCTLKFLHGIARRSACYVIRQHGQLQGQLVGRPRKIGRCSTGMVYEQVLRISDPEIKEEVGVRRITVKLDEPTRDGDIELHLLTNLPESDADARTVARLYAQRWTIETVFQEITTTLECEIETLGYPRAALFAFCMALVVFNAVSLLKASLRAVHGEEVEDKVSSYYLSLEIRGTYDGMMIAIPDEEWHVFRVPSARAFASVLKRMAKQVTLARYRKHSRGPKRPPPKKAPYANGGHVSTHKLLKTRTTSC